MYPEMTDYEQLTRDFRWDVPAQFNFAVDVIDRWARDPQRLAMHWRTRGKHPVESAESAASRQSMRSRFGTRTSFSS